MCLKFDINTFDARSNAMNQNEPVMNVVQTELKQNKKFTITRASHVTLCMLRMAFEYNEP